MSQFLIGFVRCRRQVGGCDWTEDGDYSGPSDTWRQCLDPERTVGSPDGGRVLAAVIRSRLAVNLQLSVSNGSFLCKHVTLQFPSLGAANPVESDQSAQGLGSCYALCVGLSATPG